jgi:type 1 glutamine amidotransferase
MRMPIDGGHFFTGQGEPSAVYLLYIAAPAHPCARGIQYFLYIAAPAHPCARGIQYFLYISEVQRWVSA